jgi:ElaB/YqjD/DUF883 family membrane-anchored ribosome-binding protein
MENTMDTDAGSEMFASYENELKLVQADLNQKLDQIAEASGEQRKSAIANAEQVLDEAMELVSAQHPEKGTTRQEVREGKKRRQKANPTIPHLARPTAHGEAEHPFLGPVKSQRPLPQLLNRYRRGQAQAQVPIG